MKTRIIADGNYFYNAQGSARQSKIAAINSKPLQSASTIMNKMGGVTIGKATADQVTPPPPVEEYIDPNSIPVINQDTPTVPVVPTDTPANGGPITAGGLFGFTKTQTIIGGVIVVALLGAGYYYRNDIGTFFKEQTK